MQILLSYSNGASHKIALGDPAQPPSRVNEQFVLADTPSLLVTVNFARAAPFEYTPKLCGPGPETLYA